MRFSIPVQQFLIHGRIANIILVKKKQNKSSGCKCTPSEMKKKKNQIKKTKQE